MSNEVFLDLVRRHHRLARQVGSLRKTHGNSLKDQFTSVICDVENHLIYLDREFLGLQSLESPCKEQMKVVELNQKKIPLLFENIRSDWQRPERELSSKIGLVLDEIEFFLDYEYRYVLPLFEGKDTPFYLDAAP